MAIIDPVTYSKYLTLGELPLFDEHTELSHVLVQPLGKLIAGQWSTILALERLSQGRDYVRCFIRGLSFCLGLGGGHGDENDCGMTVDDVVACPWNSHAYYVSHFSSCGSYAQGPSFRIASMIYEALPTKGSAVIFVLAEWVEWVPQETRFTTNVPNYNCGRERGSPRGRPMNARRLVTTHHMATYPTVG